MKKMTKIKLLKMAVMCPSLIRDVKIASKKRWKKVQ